MNIKDVLNQVKEAVLAVKQQKQDVISVDAMAHYLDALIKDTDGKEATDQKTFEANLVTFRAEQDAKIEEYKADEMHNLEMFRSVINFAGAALKSAMLINGGAAAALLAFIGNVWTKGVAAAAVNSLTSSVFFFAFGVLVAALGTMTSYFTQYCYHDDYQKVGVGFHIASVTFVIASFVLFGIGAYDAYTAFVQHLESQIPSTGS